MIPCSLRALRRALGMALSLAVCATHAPAGELEALARRFAPVLRQDTASDQDYITRFDFDGNWNGDDNWENQPHFEQAAWVYWAGVETETHAYLTYGFFHPRDYSWWNNPIVSHENDLEGMLAVVEKAEDGPKLVAVETVFHLDFLRLEVPGGYPSRKPDGELILEGERPVLFIEAKGHGVKEWDGSEFPGGDGVVYRLGEIAEVPAHPDDRDVRYDLLEIETSLWARRHDVGPTGTYAKAQEFAGEHFGYAFNGTDHGDHKANAPWGWKAEGLPRGAFFLDPAAMVAEHFVVPSDFGREYAANPFTRSVMGKQTGRQTRFRELYRGFLD